MLFTWNPSPPHLNRATATATEAASLRLTPKAASQPPAPAAMLSMQVVSAQRKHQDTLADKVLDLQFYHNRISG